MWTMAKSVLEWTRGGRVFSYKRVTISICLFNLLAAIYVIRSISVFSSYPSDIWHTTDQAKRIEESAVVRRALGPVELFRLAEKLRANTLGKRRELELVQSVKRKLADEILQRLRVLGDGANLTEQREALGLWHAEKLKALKQILPISEEGSSMAAKEAKMLASALESDWVKLLEDIGLWIPSIVKNYEINDRPENATEYEEDTVPGPPLPPECHAEPHTDYDGAAVRWGLTHHKATAADCCRACIDQANDAKLGQTKCNIWVYCPSEFGCYSPDVYEHRFQECWLKQAKKPRLNFKNKYSETYRDSHPTAPVAVPWISGVISS
ncbi:uncharacterized protein LOC110101555 isoform X1 [Dendrobium catenatum]|uniref:Apple domain-containing protein n=1 Tax=Dendrobium catenatum TaxID=906689 RepID=A0A2I0W1G1_9ASPA|nr:uncharacterized protein LOC110101555 isoform X1 [Dendrobium catenatum]PKU69492.1 hypothetical protein MA16_Dca015364 [Dendrobium catenatum]